MENNAIRGIIQQEMFRSSQSNRFNISNIPRHIHNDIDSPFVFQPVLTYAGIINTDASVQLIPSGWTIVNNSTGVYTITHNLGTVLYSVVASCLFTNHRNVAQVTSLSENSFVINTFFYGPTTLENSGFTFILSNVNNKLSKNPNYTGTLIS